MTYEVRKGRMSFRLEAPYSEERKKAAIEAAKKKKGNLWRGSRRKSAEIPIGIAGKGHIC